MSDQSDERLEQVQTPNLKKVVAEINDARADCDAYWQDAQSAHGYFHCHWKGQHEDRCKHSDGEEEAFPWDGASDARVRVVQPLIREHVSFALFTFLRAKVQMRAMRPLTEGRISNVAEKLLKWRIYTHMRQELLTELPLAYTWMFTRGLVVIGIEWEQQRTIEEVPVSAQDAQLLFQEMGAEDQLLELFSDADPSPTLLDFIQSFSPIINRDRARKILSELRRDLQTTVPIVFLVENKPKWTALRMVHDVLLPSSASSIQSERWINRRELVTESELTDRIETENYDPDFVTEAIKKKGEFAGWHVNDRFSATAIGGERDLIELQHFYSRRLVNGTPCVYRTVFSESVMGIKTDLCALHQVHPYKHKQYPFVLWRWQAEHRMLLHERGIAHEAWSDEQDIKKQQDGLNDRSDLINRPPMFIPSLRYEALKGRFKPGHYLAINRPNELTWPPLPPSDQTPLKVMELVKTRLDERYALFGPTVDPALKEIRREHLAGHMLAQFEQTLEQTWQLQQQYETQAEVERVAGKSELKFPASTKDIQGRYEISATIDTRMLNEDYAEHKIDLITRAMAFKQEGLLFKMAVELIDPDAADAIAQDQASPEAMEKERKDEKHAFGLMMAGVEPDLPMMGNHQLRLQTMQQLLSQPNMPQRLQSLPDSQKLIQNRVQFFQRQIQQFTQNPAIGRALTGKTFQPQQAPDVAMSSNGSEQ
jgi:hypothetical protein